MGLNEDLNALLREEDTTLNDELNQSIPGLSPEKPIDERSASVPPSLRFAIMTAGGGGEAGGRMLQAEGIDAVHRGGMNYSVRDPDGYWRVMDPSKLELPDFTSDIFGDVGSIAAMTGGAILGAPGGLPGMAAGAAGGGAVAQGARTALGSLAGIEPTGGEFASDIAYEAAIGGGSELLAGAAAPILRGIGKRVFPKRFTTEERVIRSAIPNETSGEFRSHWDIADMPEPTITREWLKGERPSKIPLHEGQVVEATDELAGQVTGYTYRDLQTKLAREKYPDAAATIEKMAAGEGKSRVDMAVVWIDEMLETPGTKTEKLYKAVDWGAPEPELFENLTSIIARSVMSGQQRRDMVRQLARTWGIQTEGVKDRALTRQVLLRMSDGDFVYREAARKSGVTGAFSPEANLDDLMRQVYDIEVERWKRIQATRAISDAEAGDIIEAGFAGGPMRQFAKEPPFSLEEHLRASEMAPFIRGERYGEFTRREYMRFLDEQYRLAKESFEAHPTESAGQAVFDDRMRRDMYQGYVAQPGRQRPPLERPRPARERARDTDRIIEQMNRDRARLNEPPLTRKEISELEGRRRTKSDVRYEKLRQEADIAEEEYRRRVYGELPELTGSRTKVHGGPPYLSEPLVDIEARSRQIFERRTGVPWEKAKGRPGTATGPETKIAPQGFLPGKEGGFAAGGMIPRGDAVDFWRFISLKDMTRLRVGGREIPLTAPQREVVNRTIYMMALSPGMKAKAKWINRIAGTLQLPRNLLKTTLQALARQSGTEFRAMGGGETARGLTGAVAGALMGGGPGAVVGFAGELVGRGAAAIGKRLMREPDEALLRELIEEAMRQESSRAARVLTRASETLQTLGKDAFRAMIYEAMHDPEVRKVFEGGRVE